MKITFETREAGHELHLPEPEKDGVIVVENDDGSASVTIQQVSGGVLIVVSHGRCESSALSQDLLLLSAKAGV